MLRLRRRSDFLRAKRGHSYATPGLVLQVLSHPLPTPARFGLIASRKVGNAPARNRARRRLRALAKAFLPRWGKDKSWNDSRDYVLIARSQTATLPWATLQQNLKTCLERLAQQNKTKQV